MSDAPPATDRRQRLLIRAVALGIVLVALLVAGGVVAWRMANTGQSDMVFAPWERLDGEPWLLPDLRNAQVIAPDRPHDPQQVMRRRAGDETALTRTRTATLNTNAQRLRGREDVGEKEPGTFRIISLGESVAHGWGLDDDEAYPVQLEEILRDQGHSVEVLNAGVPSLGSRTMALWCERVAPELEPDLLLWMRRPFGGNTMQAEVARCRQAIGVPVVVLLPPVSTFDIHGNRVGAAEATQVQRAMPDVPVHDLTPGMRAAQAGRPGVVLVDRGGQLTVEEQVGGEVLLTLPPGSDRLTPEVYALLEADPSVREPLFFDEGHPDAEGARIMAGLVAEAIAPELP